MKKKVYIYHQHHLQAGHAVSQQDLEMHNDPDNADDWFFIENTPEKLLEYANLYASGNGVYDYQVARTLREAISL